MKIRVMIAEMDEAQRKLLADMIGESENTVLVGTAENGWQALEMVERVRPDVLLCGMVLAGLDGCALLQRFQEMEPEEKPVVLMLSGVKRDDLISRAFALGADDYLVKPCDRQTLLSRIAELVRQRTDSMNHQVDQRLSSILLGLGIPAHVKGYRFLQEAVRATMMDPGLMTHMMHDLYPRVPHKYQTTPGCVERSIRNAICMAWERGRPEENSRLLGRSVSASYERPTSGELIALVAERMRWNM